MFKTIFQRLFWTSAAIVFFTVVVVSVSMFSLLNKYVDDERFFLARKATDSVEHLTMEIARQGFGGREMMFYNTTLESWSMLVNAEITVISGDGKTFAETESKNAIPDSYISAVLSGENVSGRAEASGEKPRYSHIIGIPLKNRGMTVGGIFYFFPPGVGGSTIKSFTSTLFLTLLIALLLALVLIYLEARHMTKPLRELNHAVLEIASGKFDKRVDIASNDEVSQLASSFNYMADSLSHLEEMRSGFISDISHELRTPMTSISGFVQGILDGTIPKEKEREYLEIVLDESNRLARLTNEMFEMTKMNSPGYRLSVQKFDVNEMVRLCVISSENKLEAKELEVDVDFENETENVLADPDAIKRVIINLFDNAVKFSHNKTTIKIRVYERNKKVWVDIVNYGTGISPEDIGHIFDRFYKSDKSRGRDKAGAGLGLSFVKNILNRHAQTISAESKPYEENIMETKFSFTLEKA